MNAAVSSVLTQFLLIHIQLCAPLPAPLRPPALRDGNSVSTEMLPLASPQIPGPSLLIQLITVIDMQAALTKQLFAPPIARRLRGTFRKLPPTLIPSSRCQFSTP